MAFSAYNYYSDRYGALPHQVTIIRICSGFPVIEFMRINILGMCTIPAAVCALVKLLMKEIASHMLYCFNLQWRRLIICTCPLLSTVV